MSTSYEYFDYAKLGGVINSLYQHYGNQVFTNDFVGLSSVSITSDQATLVFEWGAVETLRGTFSQSEGSVSGTINEIQGVLNGELAFKWTGSMSVSQFVSGNWPEETQYGDGQANFMTTYLGSSAFGGDGNDYMLFMSGGYAAGGAGSDTFIIPNHAYSQNIIGDYQPGDKLVFPDFASSTDLIRSVVGIQQTGTGFKVAFQNTHDGYWTLEFQNLTPGQLHMEDVLTGSDAIAALQPLIGAYGNAADWYFA